jgi:hypothetical protein
MGGHATVLENLHPAATVTTRVMGVPELQKMQGYWVPAALTLVVIDGHVLDLSLLDVTALDLSARCSDPLDDGSIRPASWETFSLLMFFSLITSFSLINLSFKLLTS